MVFINRDSIAVAACAVAGLAGLVSAGDAGAAVTVSFVPGTYYLSTVVAPPPGATNDTLVVSVSGGVAKFSLSGVDFAAFSVEDGVAPSGFVDAPTGPDPYYTGAAILSASWNTSTYPYLTFYSAADYGGVSAATDPSDTGGYAFSPYESTTGTGQVFTVALPEPGAWAMMLVGIAGMGALLRGRARKDVASV